MALEKLAATEDCGNAADIAEIKLSALLKALDRTEGIESDLANRLEAMLYLCSHVMGLDDPPGRFAVPLGSAVSRDPIVNFATMLALAKKGELAANEVQHALRLAFSFLVAVQPLADLGVNVPAKWCTKAEKEATRLAGLMQMVGSSSGGGSPGGAAETETKVISEAKRQWERLRRAGAPEIEDVSNLMEMVGLEKVKQKVVDVYNRIQLDKEKAAPDAPDYGVLNFNARFVGNAGTGKTTAAKRYAGFLMGIGVLPSAAVFMEVNSGDLARGHDPIKPLKEDTLATIQAAGGGVLFLDEAPDLIPKPQVSVGFQSCLYNSPVEVSSSPVVLSLVSYPRSCYQQKTRP
jgi:hypothetical protein